MQGPFSQPAAHHPTAWNDKLQPPFLETCPYMCPHAWLLLLFLYLLKWQVYTSFDFSNDLLFHHIVTILSTSPSSVCLIYFHTGLFNKALPSRTILSQVFPGVELPSQDCYPSFNPDLIPSLSISATELHHLNYRDFSSGFLNLFGAPCLIHTDKT